MAIAQQENKNLSPKINSQKTYNLWWLYLLLLFLLFAPSIFNFSKPIEQISWLQFENNFLKVGAVEKVVVINKERAEVYMKSSFINNSIAKEKYKIVANKTKDNGPNCFVNIGSIDSFEKKLEPYKVNLLFVSRQNWFSNILNWILPIFLIIVSWNYIFSRYASSGSNGIFNFGRSKPLLIDNKTSSITFEDVAGLEEAEMEVKEIVDFLKNPSLFTKLGAKIPKGIILVGPTGTGKTLLAKAVAGEAKVPFFSISGSEFVEMFVGVGASRVRDLFRMAKEKSPCIVFIDEIDAIGRSRGKGSFLGGANDEREGTLNQLLTEMDGFGTNSGVIVLAATNRADILDSALLRPGRFDRHIYLELPNIKEREAIFNVHLKNIIYDKKMDISFMASQTPGFSGADIANICNEAALIAARRKLSVVGKSEFSEAIDRVIAGLEKKSKIVSQKEKKIIACHEAGHAIVGWFLPSTDPLLKVSIIPRGNSLGAAWYLPEEKYIRSKSVFNDYLCTSLGGRAAEELVFNEIYSGSLDDLEKATKNAYMMVVYYGFNEKMGNVSYYDSSTQQELNWQKPFSEDTSKLIDNEIRILIAKEYDHAKIILNEHKDLHEKLMLMLLEKEVVYKEQLENLLGKKIAA